MIDKEDRELLSRAIVLAVAIAGAIVFAAFVAGLAKQAFELASG